MIDWTQPILKTAELLTPFATLITLSIALIYLSKKEDFIFSSKLFRVSFVSFLITTISISASLTTANLDSVYEILYFILGLSSFLIGLIFLALGTISYSLYDFGFKFLLDLKPDIGFLKYPLSDKEDFVKEITVPPNKKIIIYFAIKIKSELREYKNPLIWILFSKGFEIAFKLKYENLFFGKKLTILKKGDLLIKYGGKLYKEQTNPFIFPVVVKTPSELRRYKVKIMFTAENIRTSINRDLVIDVKRKIDKKDLAYFNYRLFQPKI